MSLRNGVRVIFASALKEWRIRRRYPSFFLGILIYPMLLPGVYLLQAHGFAGGDARALSAFASRAGTTELAGFLYVGGAMYMWVSIILWGPGMTLQDERVRGSLEQVFLTPASRFAVLFGATPIYALQAIWMFAVVFTALRLVFGVALSPSATARALAVILISIPSLFAMGALFATAVMRFRDVGGAAQVVRGVFQLLCGMTFPIVVLPGWAQAVARALPPTYVMADIRQALLTGARLVSLVPDFAILTGLAALLGALAMLSFQRTELSARRFGTLGQY